MLVLHATGTLLEKGAPLNLLTCLACVRLLILAVKKSVFRCRYLNENTVVSGWLPATFLSSSSSSSLQASAQRQLFKQNR